MSPSIQLPPAFFAPGETLRPCTVNDCDPKTRPELASVTLVAVSSVAIAATISALQVSMSRAKFAHVLLLSDQRPPRGTDETIEWRQIDPIASRIGYSRFMLRELADHIATSHVLCVQWDGFVLQGAAWDPAFLDYDYIGAIWPQFHDGHDVGNGGFSLRSRRLLEACRELPYDGSTPEDVVICRLFRQQLEAKGISFAPQALAQRFSYERTRPSGHQFGFHGALNLVQLLESAEASLLIESLEPGMLAKNERWEVLRWALRNGQFRLALDMFRRLA